MNIEELKSEIIKKADVLRVDIENYKELMLQEVEKLERNVIFEKLTVIMKRLEKIEEKLRENELDVKDES